MVAAFGVPRVAEDDAIRAVRAAVGMQRAFRDLLREPLAPACQIGLRVAVNTGERSDSKIARRSARTFERTSLAARSAAQSLRSLVMMSG